MQAVMLQAPTVLASVPREVPPSLNMRPQTAIRYWNNVTPTLLPVVIVVTMLSKVCSLFGNSQCR